MMVRSPRVFERYLFSAFLHRQNWSNFTAFRSSSTKAARLPRMDYQDAVCTLNTLQTNAMALEQVRQERKDPQLQLQAMRSFLQRSGLTGSTCAFTEQILRNYGFRTGFYSSPHLVQVRERIRIDGQPISKELFTKYFWQVYGRLDETKDAHGGSMPAYFRFLTILAFHPGVPAFTVKQPDGPMAVLQERAQEIQCPLHVCPELAEYLAPSAEGNSGVSQALPFQPSPTMLKGLKDTEWPGRTQTLRHDHITYFLDGAHTTRSMLACVRWFSEAAAHHERTAGVPAVRVLLYNATGERDSAAMLKLLVPCHFDFAVFCPNITEVLPSSNADQQNFNVTVENMLTRCLDNQRSWKTLSGQEGRLGAELEVGGELLIPGSLPLVADRRNDTLVFPCILSALQWISQGRDPVLAVPEKRVAPVQPSVAAKATPLREAAQIHVLVTGSLHLVGGVLKHLDPSSAS
ncbi:hypothetical protein JZ751_016699 [Albula glossodonta]|uniref:tetrahydrofolate synthase n=1 Tax=Albula glossodonta TaxID=121402 RepID=A0A8T2P0N7_9TELE|nr:hypothetical protein JZ751_016699 [Albula glossodonta]